MGDALIEPVYPRRHSPFWETGPEPGRRVARFFAGDPNAMRLVGAAKPGFALWLALRQYREE